MQARNFAVMTGVNAGLACVMKRIRGAEDVQGRLVMDYGGEKLLPQFEISSLVGNSIMTIDFFFCLFSMVAAFGSGAMFSVVSGMGGAGPNQAANAISSGILFALVQGTLFQVLNPKP